MDILRRDCQRQRLSKVLRNEAADLVDGAVGRRAQIADAGKQRGHLFAADSEHGLDRRRPLRAQQRGRCRIDAEAAAEGIHLNRQLRHDKRADLIRHTVADHVLQLPQDCKRLQLPRILHTQRKRRKLFVQQLLRDRHAVGKRHLRL